MSNGQCKGDGMFYHVSKVNLRTSRMVQSTTFMVGERKTVVALGWYSTWVGMVPEGVKRPFSECVVRPTIHRIIREITLMTSAVGTRAEPTSVWPMVP